MDGAIDQIADAEWIATSKWFLDRQACRWMGLCGLAHFHPDPAKSWKHKQYAREQDPIMGDHGANDFRWEDTASNRKKLRPEDWKADTRVLKEVPQFVLDHAPIVHLYSDEQFWPSNIAEHLEHMRPYVNHTSLKGKNKEPSVNNLHELNEGRWAEELFLQSKDDVEERPDWLGSAYNKPIPYDDDDDEDESDKPTSYTDMKISDIPLSDEETKEWGDPLGTDSSKVISAPFISSQPPATSSFELKSRGNPRKHKRRPVLAMPGGYSPAPAILIVVDKGNGVVDAFWFYFYSYNLGTTVLGIRFGNHIGDWEHSLVRFHNGVPKAIFFSAHAGGLAYSYDAVEKGKGKGREGRPIIYSAKGSHAMYATPGNHPYILPFGLLADVADKGPLWDPALNYMAYHFNTSLTHGADAYAHYLPEIGNPTPSEMRDTIQPALDNPAASASWFWFSGHWGDNFYILGDWRQWRFVGQYHYVNGPYGPRWKNLGRSKICQSHGKCTILKSLVGDQKRTWLGTRAIDTYSGEYIY